MANTFKKTTAPGTITGSTVLQVPAGSTVVIIGMTAANIGGVTTSLSLKIGSSFYMKDIIVPDGSTVSMLDGKLVLLSGDVLSEICSADDGVEFTVSYMEITSD